jgi:hypothetical protein
MDGSSRFRVLSSDQGAKRSGGLRATATGRIVSRMYEPLSDTAGPPEIYVRNAPPPPATQTLEGPKHVDTAVIGAGFTDGVIGVSPR